MDTGHHLLLGTITGSRLQELVQGQEQHVQNQNKVLNCRPLVREPWESRRFQGSCSAGTCDISEEKCISRA